MLVLTRRFGSGIKKDQHVALGFIEGCLKGFSLVPYPRVLSPAPKVGGIGIEEREGIENAMKVQVTGVLINRRRQRGTSRAGLGCVSSAGMSLGIATGSLSGLLQGRWNPLRNCPQF